MQESLDASLVRIYTADGRIVGAGFLVGERHILTCAHVISQALNLPDTPSDAPQTAVSLDFPLLSPRTLFTAKVVQWCPLLSDGRGDIAGLELQRELPTGAEAVRFADASDVWKHPFRAFGFPTGSDDGVWATGRLLGRQATDWLMIEDIKAQGFAVAPGFSGTPVWDELLQGVVGMVVAASRPIDLKAAFVLPLDVLMAAWPVIESVTRQRVFLSSAPADTAFADRLRTDLEALDIVVWTEQQTPDNDQTNKEEGIRQAIRAAQAVVLVVSSQTRSSRTVKEHLRLADVYSRRLILAWVGDESAQPQHYGWRETIWVDAHSTQYATALQAIEANLSQRRSISTLLGPSSAAPEKEPRNPYKGLRAFTAGDAGDFFGRDRLVDELVKDINGMLAAKQPTSESGRFLTIIGPSGSGKSSVVMAGLLPKLQHGAFPGSESWVFLSPIVPGKHPIEALALTLKPHFPDTSFKTLREDLEDDTTRGLHVLATQLAKQPRRGGSGVDVGDGPLVDSRRRLGDGVWGTVWPVVLLIDQFEELFTQTESEDERRRFIDLLLTATTEPRGPLIVLLTLRADFYHRLMQYPELYRLIEAHHRPVLLMEVDDLRATIEQPAALPDVQLTFEGNLVGDLLFEIQGQIGALPLLQFTLEQLFERRSGHRLTLQAYREIGGVKGALSQHAEQTYAALSSEEHRQLARALFVRLIDPGASEQDTTRRRAALSEFTLADPTQTRLMRETIDTFIAARLLTTNEIVATTTLEVSHEAVIREWPRLAGWLREAREDIPLQQALSEDVAEWEHRGKPRDRLYRGSQLKDARAWARRNLPSSNEMAFLQAGTIQRVQTLVGIILVVLLLVPSLGIAGWKLFFQPPPTLVTTTQDNVVGSLRWCMNNAPSGSTIMFAQNVRRLIKIMGGDLVVGGGKQLTIVGPGADQLTISGGTINAHFHVSKGATLHISGLSFKNSETVVNAFLFNEGTLTVTNSFISDNKTTADVTNLGVVISLGLGGGIVNRGTLAVTDSTISGNTVTTGWGGGIANFGKFTLTNSTISGNTATNGNGGILNYGGTLTLTNSTVSGNRALGDPAVALDGGIGNDLGGTLTLTNSTVSGNTASGTTGGIGNSGTLTLTNSIISGNTASSSYGGIVSNGTLILNNSTISDNTASSGNGGGVSNLPGGMLILTNSTISGNTASSYGGGIFIQSQASSNGQSSIAQTDLTFSTIYSNMASVGADIAVEDVDFTNGQPIKQVSQVKISNSIVAGDPVRPDISGTLISSGYNLFQDNSGAAFDPATRTQHSTDRTVSVNDLSKLFADPARLRNNGGPTMTYALGPGSPAIDAIPLQYCQVQGILNKQSRIYTDQRGMKRPDENEQFCDIGAYEAS